MKKIIKIILLFFVTIVLWNCNPNVVNLQKVDVIGSSIKNPVKIVEKKERGNIDFSFNLSVNNSRELIGRIDGHTEVNENGIFELEPVDGEDFFLEYKDINQFEFKDKNFNWITPSLTSQFDLDFAFSKNFALTFGTKYSGYEDENYWGHSLGLAYFSQQNDWAYRFDLFFRYQKMLYDVTYVRTENISFDNNNSLSLYL